MSLLKALQDYTFTAKYARYIEDKKRRETYKESVDRVRNMMHRKYADKPQEVHDLIDQAYDFMAKKKILGSQRALQFGGDPIFSHNARIFNCTVSYVDRLRFFQECMYMLLCGCGVGFSVQKHHISKLPEFAKTRDGSVKYVVPDSIKGWSDAIGVLVTSYFEHDGEFAEFKGKDIKFDLSKISPKGTPLSSGGKAPGPEPLKKALKNIKAILDGAITSGRKNIKSIEAYDIIMHASDAVISGGVRRSATICLFSPDDEEMATAKTGNWFLENPQRGRSNNSALLLRNETSKEQFAELMKSVKEFGEPGFIWADSVDFIANPCVEIGMYPVDVETGESGWQGCNLSTINCAKVSSKEDFIEAARMAAIVGTLQAGFTTFPYLGEVSEKIFRRESLLGVSGTGWFENPEICLDPDTQREAALAVIETNKIVSKLIGIPQAARTTCVKPEGCLTKNTIIQTSDGILSLDEIGDIYGEEWQDIKASIVTDFDNQEVSKFYINGLKPIKQILTSGGIEISATHSHKFRVIRDSKYLWVESKDLQIGDKMPYKVGGYNFGSKQYLNNPNFEKSKYTSNIKDFNPIEYIDEDFAWFLGLYTGDGSNHENKNTIRIHGDYRRQENLIKAKNILKNKFGIDSYILKYNKDENDNRCALYITSKQFYSFLSFNNLLKSKSNNISIPLAIRKSNKEVILSFIDGYGDADGCVKSRTRSFCTTSKVMADQLVQCLRAVGIDCKMRLMPSTNTSFGNSMRYWIQERIGRNSVRNQTKYDELNNLGLNNFSFDEIIDIQDSINYTYDITVNHKDHTYIANSYVSHNTASCILGTSSGIHPHHAKRYIRRVQANKMEIIYNYFKSKNPRACEESVWSANGTDDVISFCVEVPDGSKTKNQVTAIELLKTVKSTQENWVMPGKIIELCTKPWLNHNVSNTINVKPDEWDGVEDFIYENRDFFCGISLLPITGDKDYPQAPFTTVYLPTEMVSHYGDGVMFVSGLIEVAMNLWEDNLWAACDSLMGIGSPPKGKAKLDWVDRCNKFAEKYFDSNVKKLTYCMKDVYNYKLWTELKREYVDVDYTAIREESDSTELEQVLSCSGGACELV